MLRTNVRNAHAHVWPFKFNDRLQENKILAILLRPSMLKLSRNPVGIFKKVHSVTKEYQRNFQVNFLSFFKNAALLYWRLKHTNGINFNFNERWTSPSFNTIQSLSHWTYPFGVTNAIRAKILLTFDCMSEVSFPLPPTFNKEQRKEYLNVHLQFKRSLVWWISVRFFCKKNQK